LALALAGVLSCEGFLRNSAAMPTARAEAGWLSRHANLVEEAHRGDIDVLFLGDSITEFWSSQNPWRGGKPVWDREFAPMKAINFGIGGDRTQNVLWRLQNGEAEGYQPRAVVLMIGTNNLGVERDGRDLRNTTGEVAGGITAIVHELQRRWPSTRILLMALLPRNQKDAPHQYPYREKIVAINRSIAALQDGRRVFFLDIGAKFLGADGEIQRELMPDLLHPSLKGYEIWAGAIKEPLARWLRAGSSAETDGAIWCGQRGLKAG
jgi:lysophospholipase L1-like esterase